MFGALDNFEHLGFPGVGVEFSGLLDGHVIIQAPVHYQDGSVEMAGGFAQVVSGAVFEVVGP